MKIQLIKIYVGNKKMWLREWNSLNACTGKEDRYRINNISSHLRKLGAGGEEKLNPKKAKENE